MLAVARCNTTQSPAVSGIDASKIRRDAVVRAEPLRTGQRSNTSSSVSAVEPPRVEPSHPSNPELEIRANTLDVPQVELTLEAVVPEGTRQRPTGDVAGAVFDEALQTWNYGGRSDMSHISNRMGYHPGTRVVVDATPRVQRAKARSKSGMKVATLIVAGLRNRGYWPFRNCFENETRNVTDPGGKTFLRVSLNGRGAVVSVRVIRSTLKTKTVSRCIANAMRSLRTDRPLGIRVDADVVVAVYPGDLPLLGLPVEPANPRAYFPELDQILSNHLASFVPCFSVARKADSKLWGRLLLTFSVDNDGKPSEVRERESHFGDSQARECVSFTLGSLRLPISERSERLQLGFRLNRPPEPTDVVNDRLDPNLADENTVRTPRETETAPSVSESPTTVESNAVEVPSTATEQTRRPPGGQR